MNKKTNICIHLKDVPKSHMIYLSIDLAKLFSKAFIHIVPLRVSAKRGDLMNSPYRVKCS